MSNSTAGGSSVFGILNQKGFTKEEIDEMSNYLDLRISAKQRFAKYEMRIYFFVLCVLILVVPGALQGFVMNLLGF